MRYRLRTLLIVLALLPPIVAGLWSLGYLAWVQGRLPPETGGAIGREIERARTAPPWNPAIHACQGETYDEWEERMERQRRTGIIEPRQ